MAYNLSKESIALIFLGLGTVGCILNVMMMSTFYMAQDLIRTEFIFFGLMMASDLIMTFGVFPEWAASMIIDSEYFNIRLCNIEYMFALISIYCFSWFSMFSVIEQFSMLINRIANKTLFSVKRITIITTVILFTSLVCGYVGSMKHLDHDYCEFTHKGNTIFRVTTAIVFIIFPCCINIIFQFAGMVAITLINKGTHYKRSRLYRNDLIQIAINFLSFSTFLLMWTPYIFKVWMNPNAEINDIYFYGAIGMSRSVFGSIFFLICTEFSDAYGDVMTYTFYKRNIYKRHRRHRRGPNYTTPGENASSYYLRPMVIHDPVRPNSGVAISEV